MSMVALVTLFNPHNSSEVSVGKRFPPSESLMWPSTLVSGNKTTEGKIEEVWQVPVARSCKIYNECGSCAGY